MKFGGLKKSASRAALIAAATVITTGAYAADLGGDCCADLEERVAELEATAARKGNRKVSLTVYGQVNEAVIFWDDGRETNAYVVSNNASRTRFGFRGELALRFADKMADEARPLLETSDVLLFPSAWVDDEPADARAAVLGSLARRTGVTIVNANWGPGAPPMRGQGASRVVGPLGELARLESAAGEARRLDVTL